MLYDLEMLVWFGVGGKCWCGLGCVDVVWNVVGGGVGVGMVFFCQC